MPPPILVVISGFLGAGKTTLSTNLIAHLWGKDLNAALITNDQSSGLVDSEIASAGGVNVKEITGGCFCCRCDEFALALDEIVALRESEIIIAEAVGSCTDLVATVVEPLRIDLMKPYRVLPMVVVVDPERAEAVFLAGGATGSGDIPVAVGQTRSADQMRVPPAQDQALCAVDTATGMSPLLGGLHDDVTYIFLKQLEEAQVILVNKADVVEAGRMEGIVGAIRAQCPEAEVMPFSAKDGEAIGRLWEYLQKTESRHRPIQEIDYERYAKGEAMLGWLNGECRLVSDGGVAMDGIADRLGAEIHRRQVERATEIAHLKVSVTASSPGGECQISVVQCVSSTALPQVVRRNEAAITEGRVLTNLRAQGEPKLLAEDAQAAVTTVEAELGVKLKWVRLDSFAPGAPNPPYQRR